MNVTPDNRTSLKADVLRFAGGAPLTLQTAASAGWPGTPTIKAPSVSTLPIGRATMHLDPRIAVALGGLGGNNAHGAGFLEALRRSGKLPQVISCTSGQLYWVAKFLLGHDILVNFEERLRYFQPFHYFYSPWQKDLDLIFKSLTNGQQPIRIATLEFWVDSIAIAHRNSWNLVTNPLAFSWWRAWTHSLPARWLVAQDLDEQSIADVLGRESDVGVMFNSYDFVSGQETIYLNERAQQITGKTPSTQNETRPWIRYEPISAAGVANALRLYEYGCSSTSTHLDGAYVRGIILSEIPGGNDIERIAVARPLPDAWQGSAPLSWAEMQDLRTEVLFQSSYMGERERIRLTNERLQRGQLTGTNRRYNEVTLLELPMLLRRGYFDYVLEDRQVFADAFWRGEELCTYL